MKGLGRKFAAVVVVLLLAAGGGWLWLRHDYKAYCASGGFVLEYHSIGSHPDWPQGMVIAPATFEKHLQYLKQEGYHMVTVAELAERLTTGKPMEKYIALSFDDGYTDNYTEAFPLLKKYGARATFSVINSKIGGKIYMTAPQIQEMERAGMEIASHTFSHNRLEDIDPMYLDWEIGTSKYDLEKRLLPKDKTVKTLAYPCGSYNAETIAKLKQFGYKAALTGNEFLNTPQWFKEHPMEMYRLIIMDDGKNAYTFASLIHKGYWRSYLKDRGIDIRRFESFF
ncbi:MAG: polysaccharide deacetylase family protein [Phascolarctobacterium sp.]|nr:polysaccharide deacetylase family protein [Phascolarctobacterium sp.]